jgi:hypothetical protein
MREDTYYMKIRIIITSVLKVDEQISLPILNELFF